MVARLNSPAQAGSSLNRWLQLIGTCGAILALVILGASMLLRLATLFGADGRPISTLPVALESAIRLSHRLAAAGVGVLAVFALILYWTRRPLPVRAGWPIALIVATTAILALIGPLTPGYRIAGVTVGNVAGGMVLLMAFWWLRELAATHPSICQPVETLMRAAVFVFLAHVATGAAASAQEMHGVRWLAFLHLGTALLAVMFIGASLWDRHRESSMAGWRAATAVLLFAQVLLGFGMMWLDARPIWLAFLHGMLSPLLAIGLVSLALRDSSRAGPPPLPSR